MIQDVSNHVLMRFWVFKGEILTHQFNENILKHENANQKFSLRFNSN